jgi:hypothetical protein
LTIVLITIICTLVAQRAVSDVWTRALRQPSDDDRDDRRRLPRRRPRRDLPPGGDEDR